MPKASNGAFFRVALEEIAELQLLDQVVATDHDELEFEVIVVARRNDLGYGVVQLVRVPANVATNPSGGMESGYTKLEVDSELEGVEIGPQELVNS
jgi:hypothetical protein